MTGRVEAVKELMFFLMYVDVLAVLTEELPRCLVTMVLRWEIPEARCA
jgi:hypothetical protein